MDLNKAEVGLVDLIILDELKCGKADKLFLINKNGKMNIVNK